jgi:hypothetical protein
METGFTDSNGESTSIISIDQFTSPGPIVITVSFAGINGTTGLLGDESWTRVVILAPTVIEILQTTGSFIAGEQVTFQGTLTDEHGQNLFEGDSPSGGILHLFIDDLDVGPLYTTQSNATTTIWNVTYDVPSDINYGLHSASLKFLGGFTWVDPMGQGDSLNPEYYLSSSANINFNISQLSQVIITTPPTEVDRNDLVLIEGQLTDKVGRVIPNRDLQVFMNEQFVTVLSVDENGEFNVFIPIPPDMELGPQIIKMKNSFFFPILLPFLLSMGQYSR